MANVARGALAGPEADARTGLAGGGAGSDFEPLTVDALGSVLLERGELDDADQLVLPVAARCDGVDRFTALFGIHARGRLRIARGDLRDGLDDLTTCRRWLEALGMGARGSIPWASEAALAHLASSVTSGRSARPSKSSSDPRRGLSTRGRSSTSGRHYAARATGLTRARRSVRASIWPTVAPRPCSPPEPGRS